MLEEIAEVLSNRCQVKPEYPLLVAVSGGVDSLCLLDILDRLKFNIIIAHFDHSLRLESVYEAEKVREISQKRDRKFVLGKGDVSKYADQKKQSIEEASRHARYRFLFEQANFFNTNAIAVGHNADDQVETILMHLLRGSGVDGLKGMSYRSLPNEWSQDIAIIRPLLGIWRAQLEEYILDNNLNPSRDLSNNDTKFLRNRIRHELVPYLEDFNPKIKQSIVQLGDIVREDLHPLTKFVDKAWEKSISEIGSGFIGFNLEQLTQQSLGVKRRLIRRAIYLLRPNLRDIDYSTITKAVEFIRSPSRSGSIDLLSGLFMSIELNQLWFHDKAANLPVDPWPQLPEKSDYKLDIPGILYLQHFWQINISAIDTPVESLNYKNDLFYIHLNRDKLDFPLTVRSRKPGDFIKPIGMGGHKIKLSDLFINKKIPKRLRHRWPIVCSRNEIVWVPGLHLSYDFQVDEKTSKTVQISLVRTKRE